MDIMKTYLLEKYGENVYNRNSYLLKLPLNELEDRYANFTTFDYYGAFTDNNFLEDVIRKRQGENKNG